MTDTASASLPCPLWRRLAALVYDLLIVLAIMLVANMIGLAVTGGQLLDEQPASARLVVPASSRRPAWAATSWPPGAAADRPWACGPGTSG